MNELNKKEIKKEKKNIIKRSILSLALISQIILLNPGCNKRNDELKHEMGKREMIETIEQKNNFSRLLYSNQEEVGGKKYILIRNMTNSIVKYDTEFTQANFFDAKIKNSGEPHLTANSSYAYVTYENNDKLSLIDTRKNTGYIINFDKPQTDVSISAYGEHLYFYSKESKLLRMSKDIKQSTEMGLDGIMEIEGKVEKLFLNKSSRGLMIMGNEFSSIYFFKIESNKPNLSRIKLNGYDEIIKNPRIVEYDKKYYIKPENENYVLEFDYKGNFIKKMEIPIEEN